MHWTIAAPFFTTENIEDAQWLDNFVPEGSHSFTKVPRREDLAEQSWHTRVSRNTSIAEWLSFWEQTREALRETEGGCITVFPQTATMLGLQERLFRRDVPTVAWCFNIGALYTGAKQSLARFALDSVDKFVVHSKQECETVSQWLKIPEDRFEFIPLQRAAIPIEETEDIEHPFLLSMGSANRDYQTLFDAVEKLGIRTVVVASQHSLENVRIPANVEVKSGLPHEDCHRLAQRAKVSVVPLIKGHTGAGQVTIIEAMRMNRPVIATRCVGSEDYIQDGTTGLLVPPYSVDAMAGAIHQLWSDDSLRTSLAKAAGEYASTHFSDEAAGTQLGKILDQFV